MAILFMVGAVIVFTVVAIIPSVRMPSVVNARSIGWMSEQWLAEHRASHSA